MTDFPEDYVDAIRAAESAQQADVCNIPSGKRPQALDDALARRVEVNLAQADGRTVVRVGGADTKVRQLEAPFSKRHAPEGGTPEPRPKRRRATKKTTDGGQRRSRSKEGTTS